MVAHKSDGPEPPDTTLNTETIRKLFPDYDPARDVTLKSRATANSNRPARPNKAERSKLPVKYLDESGTSPQLIDTPAGIPIIDVLSIKGRHFLVFERVESLTIFYAYLDCVQFTADDAPKAAIESLDYSVMLGFARIVAGPDGKHAARYVARAPEFKKPPAIVWEGSIEVPGTYSINEITPDRKLELAEWNRTVIIRSTNRGGNTREHHALMMDFKNQPARASYIDALDWTGSNYLSDLRNYVLIRKSMLSEDTAMSVRGMGPVNNDTFYSRSAVFDTNGRDLRDSVRVDLSHLPDNLDYYDITPVAEISVESIADGIRELAINYDECPTMHEIPAAFLGQIMTVPVACNYKVFFTAIFLAGIQSSGKTYYALRFDSIQSRKLRGHLKAVAPILNLGITTGTVKGQNYRANDYAGFSITSDDVLKQGDSPQRIQDRSDIVSNLVRSFLAGGGAVAKVDYKINKTTSGTPQSLKTCIKFTSELPIKGTSTLTRMVMLPFLTSEWSTGKVFDTEISKRLAMPDSRELQHLGWSAYVQWMYTRIDEMQALLIDADEYANTWGVSARVASSYAVLIAGNQMFGRFAAEHEIDIDDQIARAIAALRKCALAQEETAIPMAAQFRDAVKSAAINHKLAFPGPPRFNEDGSQAANHSEPWLKATNGEITLPAGIEINDLGMNVSGGIAAVDPRAHVFGYLLPPRTGRGPKGDPITRVWRIVFRPDYFAEMCASISREIHYNADDVIRSLAEINRGGQIRMRFEGKKNAERVIAVEAEWLLAREDEGE
jgi:hypothetical protein